LRFSRNGHLAAFTDVGPAEDGIKTVQVFALDLRSGERSQVTHLPAPKVGYVLDPALTNTPSFLDRRTLVFQTSTDPTGTNPRPPLFKPRIDGRGLEPIAPPPPRSGSEVIPKFSITAQDIAVLGINQGGAPVNNIPGFSGIVELFAFQKKNGDLLQL